MNWETDFTTAKNWIEASYQVSQQVLESKDPAEQLKITAEWAKHVAIAHAQAEMTGRETLWEESQHPEEIDLWKHSMAFLAKQTLVAAKSLGLPAEKEPWGTWMVLNNHAGDAGVVFHAKNKDWDSYLNQALLWDKPLASQINDFDRGILSGLHFLQEDLTEIILSDKEEDLTGLLEKSLKELTHLKKELSVMIIQTGQSWDDYLINKAGLSELVMTGVKHLEDTLKQIEEKYPNLDQRSVNILKKQIQLLCPEALKPVTEISWNNTMGRQEPILNVNPNFSTNEPNDATLLVQKMNEERARNHLTVEKNEQRDSKWKIGDHRFHLPSFVDGPKVSVREKLASLKLNLSTQEWNKKAEQWIDSANLLTDKAEDWVKESVRKTVTPLKEMPSVLKEAIHEKKEHMKDQVQWKIGELQKASWNKAADWVSKTKEALPSEDSLQKIKGSDRSKQKFLLTVLAVAGGACVGVTVFPAFGLIGAWVAHGFTSYGAYNLLNKQASKVRDGLAEIPSLMDHLSEKLNQKRDQKRKEGLEGSELIIEKESGLKL